MMRHHAGAWGAGGGDAFRIGLMLLIAAAGECNGRERDHLQLDNRRWHTAARRPHRLGVIPMLSYSEAQALEGEEVYNGLDSGVLSGEEGDEIVGTITIDGVKVPVAEFQPDSSENSTFGSIIFSDDTVNGTTVPPKLTRALTCAQVAAFANQALEPSDDGSGEQQEVRICRFVQEHCMPSGGILNYLELPYCATNSYPWVGGIILLVWCIILMIWLAAQVTFLIPALNTISEIFDLSESVAGVTVLAFGNGCADLFSMLAATLSGPGGMTLAIGEVLGNGMFVFCFVQGVVAIVAPFRVDSAEYARDCLVYLTSIICTFFILLDGQIQVWEGIGLLCIYALYVLLVLYFDAVRNWASIPRQVFSPARSAPLLHDAMWSRMDDFDVDRARQQRRYERIRDFPDEKQAEAMWEYLWPMEEGAVLPWYSVVLRIIQSPVIVAMRVTVPVVDGALPSSGWLRPASTIQAFLLPPITVAFVLVQDGVPQPGPVLRLSIFVASLAFGVFLAALIWTRSTPTQPPPGFKYMAIAGLGIALIWTYVTAREIVSSILVFGTVFELGSLTLGVIVLAVGIGMQDLVTCVGVARGGLSAMAAAACVGSSLMNIYVGVGISGIVGPLFVENPYVLYPSTQLLSCMLFITLSVPLALGTIAIGNFEAGTIFGIAMILIYVAFICASISVDYLFQGMFGLAA